MKIVLLLFLLESCTGNISKEQFKGIITSNQSILISCIKCNCIIEELNKIYQETPALLARYEILADSNCIGDLNPAIRYRHINQRSIDSCSTEFANMLIFKKNAIHEVEAAKVKRIRGHLEE
jgi:hypothetical protein